MPARTIDTKPRSENTTDSTEASQQPEEFDTATHGVIEDQEIEDGTVSEIEDEEIEDEDFEEDFEKEIETPEQAAAAEREESIRVKSETLLRKAVLCALWNAQAAYSFSLDQIVKDASRVLRRGNEELSVDLAIRFKSSRAEILADVFRVSMSQMAAEAKPGLGPQEYFMALLRDDDDPAKAQL